MELSCYLHKASPQFLAQTGVATGHYSTFLTFKCSVLANTSQVVVSTVWEWGRKNPKDITCCCNSRSFFTSAHLVGGPEPMNSPTSTLELHTWLRNTFAGTSALAISLLPPSPCRETLKRILHVGPATWRNWDIGGKQGGIVQFYLTYLLVPICSRVQITFLV